MGVVSNGPFYIIAIGGSAYVIVDVSFEEDISIEISCDNYLYVEGCHVRPIFWPLIFRNEVVVFLM